MYVPLSNSAVLGCPKCAALEQENAMLLEALKEAKCCIDPTEYPKTIEVIRAAIEQAKEVRKG
jgi:hypothetical protein